MPRNGSGVFSKPPGATAVPNTVIESSKFNAVVDDFVQDANAARPVTAGGTGETSIAATRSAFKLISYEAQTLTAAEQTIARSNVGAPLKGHLFGLTLSNNATDATNDIDIAIGEAASDGTTPALMTLTSALTKRLDAAWAVGSGNGGLDAGSIANTTYHLWLIQRSDTGVVDALFSASATAPTMPTNYDRKRRIGSVIRSGGALLSFVQTGDEFDLTVPSPDVNATAPGGAANTAALSVPSGIVVHAKVDLFIVATTSSALFFVGVFPTASGSIGMDATTCNLRLQTLPTAGSYSASTSQVVRTNTSGQVNYRTSASDAGTTIRINTKGWIDRRGRT